MRIKSAALELTLLTVLVLSLLLLSYTWLSLQWLKSSWLTEVQRGLSLASDTLQSSLREGMMQNRRDQLSAAIDRVGRYTQIRQIRIANHAGQVKLSTDPEMMKDSFTARDPGCNLCHTEGNPGKVSALVNETRTEIKGNSMQAFTPILAEEGCITHACHAQDAKSRVLGMVQLGLPLREMNATLAQTQWKFRTASIAAILTGGGLLWLALAMRFRRPMSDLLNGMSQVARGDLNYRIPTRKQDEFGQLAESFNSMSQQLSSLQKGLIQSERLISMGKLAAGVAHEINNPLSAILSYGEDLMEDTDPSDPVRKDYEVIVREALHCRDIVRSLLDFARQDAPVLARAHPRILIEKALDVVVRQASFQNIRFTRDIEENLPTIEADPLQIQQVLVNVIVNAQQAMPQGGEISIGAHPNRELTEIEFSIKDQGVGIPEEIRSQIFEPFFSTKGGETQGLGLSICLGIVQGHGGRIDLQTGVGEGTTFTIVFPVQQKKESRA